MILIVERYRKTPEPTQRDDLLLSQPKLDFDLAKRHRVTWHTPRQPFERHVVVGTGIASISQDFVRARKS